MMHKVDRDLLNSMDVRLRKLGKVPAGSRDEWTKLHFHHDFMCQHTEQAWIFIFLKQRTHQSIT